jgi:multimeric flavodoxin WrbA
VRTLILNGSPRRNGDTAYLLNRLKERLNHEVTEISAYHDRISPCIDCRACQKKKGCVIDDRLREIYDDGFDNVVLASPVYMSGLTPPLIGIVSRLQAFYCAKRFLNDPFTPKKKKSALIIVGGGEGEPHEALRLSRFLLRTLNAPLTQEQIVMSLHTDELPASQDFLAIERAEAAARYLNG